MAQHEGTGNPQAGDGYEDILFLPHHVSDRHPRMSLHDRAAQFAPFAALTGYEASVRERARFTEQKKELTEEEKELLDGAIRQIERGLPTDKTCFSHEILITYFVKDEKKEGGEYRTVRGRVKKIDRLCGLLLLEDGEEIGIADILRLDIEGGLKDS